MALELDDDEKFHRKNWVAERVGWGVLFIVILAGLGGAMGRGPMGEKTVQTGSLKLHYDRVMRRSAPGTIHVRLTSLPVADSVIFSVSHSILDACQPERIVPMPVRTISTQQGSIFVVRIAPGTDAAHIEITCTPETIGRFHGTINAPREASAPVDILVLP